MTPAEKEREAKTAWPNIGLYGDAITRASKGRLRVQVPPYSHNREERVLRLEVRNKEGVSCTITIPSERTPEEVALVALDRWRMLTGEDYR